MDIESVEELLGGMLSSVGLLGGDFLSPRGDIFLVESGILKILKMLIN